jgi:hypothetical protein
VPTSLDLRQEPPYTLAAAVKPRLGHMIGRFDEGLKLDAFFS